MVARPVLQFVGIGLAALLIVGVATAAASRRVGQREAITDARTTALARAQGDVEPVVTDSLSAGDPAAIAAVDDIVRSRVLDDSLVRVKIWTADGRILYSDEEDLIGATYPTDADDRAALRNGIIEAEVSDLSKPENRFERAFGKLLEVYLPIRTPAGTRLKFEAYFRYDAVVDKGRQVWESFAPVSLGGLVALELLQIPLAWSLAVRLRQRHREREVLLQRSLEASDIERRRIASDLHDGVVQDLAGVAFRLAGAARQQGLSGTASATLDDAAESVRASVSALRSSLVDIYPPNLATHGLASALSDLAAEMSSPELVVTVELDGLRALPEAVESLLYRAALEALRNTARHAHASRATVRGGVEGRSAWIAVGDDGDGFDPAVLSERAAAGHFGLRGLSGLVKDAGGRVDVETQPGAGTTVRIEVPIR